MTVGFRLSATVFKSLPRRDASRSMCAPYREPPPPGASEDEAVSQNFRLRLTDRKPSSPIPVSERPVAQEPRAVLGGCWMRLGELLIGQGLVSAEDVAAALERQREQGGRLGNHLVALGCITVEKLVMALRGLQEVGATLDMCARTFQRWQAMHGPNHPNTHRARYSYARALLAAGRAGDSLKHAEAALAGFRKTVGEHHAWTSEALQIVADARHAVAANQPEVETAA
jgi:hypothetical protein